VQRPSGIIKVEGSTIAFSRSYLGCGRECFIEMNINSWSKLLCSLSVQSVSDEEKCFVTLTPGVQNSTIDEAGDTLTCKLCTPNVAQKDENAFNVSLSFVCEQWESNEGKSVVLNKA
jgi:hypothetical protein